RAYSRSSSEVRLEGGDGAQDATGVFGGHGGGEVGGGFVVGFGLMSAPVHEEAVGQAGEDAVDSQGIGSAQPALVVAPGDVQPGVEAGLDAPVAAVEGEPADGVEAPGRRAAQQCDGLRWAALDFTPQARGLGGEGEAGLLGADRSASQDAGFVSAFVAFARAGEGLALGADFVLPGRLCTARWSLREKRQPAVRARCA
ncbi:MAG: hypothetical protein ABIZ56_02170, partial [Chthoniobacteraceae bacterium]